MMRNTPLKNAFSLSLIAMAAVGVSSAVFAQGTVAPMNQQNSNSLAPLGSQGSLAPLGQGTLHSGFVTQHPPTPTPPPSNTSAPFKFTTTVVQTNPMVHTGVQNPMPRQSTWPSPWNYIYRNSDGSLGYTPSNGNNNNNPTYLGGYYYDGYCTTPSYPGSYPSIYSAYAGLPEYICDLDPNSVEFAPPYVSGFSTAYVPFYTNDVQTPPQPTNVTYNQNNYNTNNYYVQAPTASQTPQPDPVQPDAAKDTTPAKHASYDAGSYKAAFIDIENAWVDGKMDLLQAHLRDSDTKISVSLNGKYAYSISSADFAKITRDAFSNLNTADFEFTRLRTAKNGDVTAYGTHTYLAVTQGSASSSSSKASDDPNATVPFDQPDTTPSKDTDGSVVSKKVYVSFTLRQGDDQWYVVAVDSSTTPLVTDQN